MKHMKSIAAGLCLLTLVSCNTKQGTGASIGAGAGAVLGGIIGNIIGKDSKATAMAQEPSLVIVWTRWLRRRLHRCRTPR